MDHKLNENEIFLLNLIETKDYAELTAPEKKIVDEQLSEGEFTLRRMIVKNAAHAFDEAGTVVPFPLAITAEKKTFFFRKTIPVYQVLMAAAVIVILFLVVPFNRTAGEKIRTEYIVQRDTVVAEKTVHDTIVTVKEMRVPVEKVIYVSSESAVNYQHPEPRLFESGSGFELPVLQESAVQNSGNPLSEEQSAVLIRDYLK